MKALRSYIWGSPAAPVSHSSGRRRAQTLSQLKRTLVHETVGFEVAHFLSVLVVVKRLEAHVAKVERIFWNLKKTRFGSAWGVI
jgi:hypothetical protein